MNDDTKQPDTRVPLEVVDGDMTRRQDALKVRKARKEHTGKSKQSEAAKKAKRTRRNNEKAGVI